LSAASADAPRVVATRADDPPRIDGRLSDGGWEAAFAASPFVLLGSARPATQQTTARVLYDAENLYFAFDCVEDKPDDIATIVQERDGPTYLDDCVEVFIAAGPDPARYYHLVVNAAGVLRDELGQDETWDGGATANAARTDEGWSAEVAVPLADLGIGSNAGNQWRVNLCREERPHGEISSWAPCQDGFHEPSHFGWLTHIDINVSRYARTGLSRRLERATAELEPGLSRALDARPLEAARVAAERGLQARAELDRARSLVSQEDAGLEKLREAEAALESAVDSLRAMQAALPRMNMSLALRRQGRTTAYAVCCESSMARVRPDRPYDGMPADTVHVALAAGEYEAAQLVVVPIEQSLHGVSLSVSDLKARRGSSIPQEQITINTVGCVQVTQPSARSGAEPGLYPDPLLPNAPRDIDQRTVASWLVTVHAPRDQEPGTYVGRLQIAPANAPEQELPIEVTVFDFALPRTPALRTCFQLIPSYLWEFHQVAPATGVPPGWEFGVWTGADIEGRPDYFGRGVFHSRFETESPHGGKRALRIDGEVAERGTHESPRACYHRLFPVQSQTDYEITVWYRTHGLADGQAQLHDHPHGAHLSLPASEAWSQARLAFNSGDEENARIYLCNYGLGSVWFDDLRLAPIAQPDANLVDDSGFEAAADALPRDELLRAYRLNMLEHRCSDMNVAAPSVNVSETGEVTIDWSEFDREIERYLELGLNAFNVHWARVRGGWGKVAAEVDRAERRISADILRQTEEHLKTKSWLDLAYIYTIDEPGKDAFPEVEAVFNHVHAAAPGLKRLLTFGYGASRPIRPGNPLYRRLEGSVDIWVPHSDCFEPEYLETRRRAGDEIWEYVCISAQKPYANIWGIDFPGTDPRVVFWQCYAEEIAGFLYWATDYWQKDPWQEPLTYPGGNGDGSLVYYGEAGPVNSLRWETIRDGIEDYDYLVLLESLVRQADEQRQRPGLCRKGRRLLDVSPVTRSFTDYTTSPAAIAEHRLAVARLIERFQSKRP
jgi:hypothetical protein